MVPESMFKWQQSEPAQVYTHNENLIKQTGQECCLSCSCTLFDSILSHFLYFVVFLNLLFEGDVSIDMDAIRGQSTLDDDDDDDEGGKNRIKNLNKI